MLRKANTFEKKKRKNQNKTKNKPAQIKRTEIKSSPNICKWFSHNTLGSPC